VPRIFTGIARSYDRVGAVFSFGQDPRWRHALVDAVGAEADDVVLDVATGTGLVAVELARRYGCRVVGLDRSADMLTEASRRNGLISGLVNARAERLPFADGSFDHVTFTYLLRYVDDPAATLEELARVVRPGGTVAMVEFGLPRGVWRPPWDVWIGVGLPLAGRLVSPGWHEVGRFLGPSIREFYGRLPERELLGLWPRAGIGDVAGRRLSFGAGLVVWGRRT